MTDENYPNPVHDLPPKERKVVTVDLVKSDWLLLKGCDLTHGSLTTTFNLLVSQLANECRKRGIIDFSRSTEFRELVQSIGFVPKDSIIITRAELDKLREQSEYWRELTRNEPGLRDSTPKRTPRKSNGRNVGRRASSKSDPNKTTPNPSGLQSGSGAGGTDDKGQAVSGEAGKTS